jgi:hypothetical protein
MTLASGQALALSFERPSVAAPIQTLVEDMITAD